MKINHNMTINHKFTILINEKKNDKDSFKLSHICNSKLFVDKHDVM